MSHLHTFLLVWYQSIEESTLFMSPLIPSLFEKKSLFDIQKQLLSLPETQGKDGSRYLNECVGAVDCVRYSDTGIEFQPNGRTVQAPLPHEILLLPTSVSLCGTDLALIEKAQEGKLPPETQHKVVGHEAAGFIVGLGSEVTGWELGQYVCLDSHFACQRLGHHSFQDCVMSGKSCDGIAGGIRGTLKADGARAETYDGYWSRVIAIPASALPLELPLKTAQHLKAPSTLESLGNIYMIVESIQQAGFLDKPEETLCIVSGLGATGYPMAAVATHYGFDVMGINPSEGKRTFALQQGACQETFAQLEEVATKVKNYKKVVIVVTADVPAAHEQALQFLNTVVPAETERLAIIFGLFADPALPLPLVPAPYDTMPQREFVFSRHSCITPSGVQVIGVCGRDIGAWEMLLKDLQPDAQGNPPHLVAMLNAAQYQVPGTDVLKTIAETLNQGTKAVESTLAQQHALKLVANLLV